MTTVLSTVAGVVLIAAALFDVFQTLLRPGGTGRLTVVVFRATWRLVSRGRRRATISGPATILTVILIWIALITIGWALIFLPHLPDGFAYNGVEPDRYYPFVEAMTLSLVTLTTLGYGDAVPTQEVLRAVSPLEALMGFAILTAAVSWFMQIYPALARRRSFAIRLTSMKKAGLIDDLPSLTEAHSRAVLDSATQAVADITADLAQNAEIFYFRERDATMSMPRAAGYLLDLRDRALACDSESLRRQAAVLEREIDELSALLRRQYPHVRGETSDEVLSNVADSHGHRFGD